MSSSSSLRAASVPTTPRRMSITSRYINSCNSRVLTFYSSKEVDGKRVIETPTLTVQFMAGKRVSREYYSMYDMSVENLGPFNHSNIMNGYLRVSRN